MQKHPLNIVLIVGSSPDAKRCESWHTSNLTVVAINNAWRIRDDWDYLVYAGDFPKARRPPSLKPGQQSLTYDTYVPVQNRYGGFVYAGGTMAFTTAYWALGTLQPNIMAFIGCDMVYPTHQTTHFYGHGSADPLRDDVTLQSLEAKSQRLYVHALEQNCLCMNLSSLAESRLVFPTLSYPELTGITKSSHQGYVQQARTSYDHDAVNAAKQREKALGYFVASGEYWKHLDRIDSNELASIDEMWLDSITL